VLKVSIKRSVCVNRKTKAQPNKGLPEECGSWPEEAGVGRVGLFRKAVKCLIGR